MTARYALYFAPLDDRPLWRFGSATIGWDAETATASPPLPPSPALADGWREATAEPRRYGFHATLKAPFALADDVRVDDLLDAAATFAATPRAIPRLRLEARIIVGFVALVPDAPDATLDALAAACVRDFDGFRAPLTPQDRAHRAPERLTPRQRDYLDRWGYPYVFEEFRFHMTLTGQLPPGEAEAAREALASAHRAACGGRAVAVSTLAVFVQSTPGAPFRILASWPLRAA
jgi:putative phosphonate metabolism protein